MLVRCVFLLACTLESLTPFLFTNSHCIVFLSLQLCGGLCNLLVSLFSTSSWSTLDGQPCCCSAKNIPCWLESSWILSMAWRMEIGFPFNTPPQAWPENESIWSSLEDKSQWSPMPWDYCPLGLNCGLFSWVYFLPPSWNQVSHFFAISPLLHLSSQPSWELMDTISAKSDDGQWAISMVRNMHLVQALINMENLSNQH